MSKNIQEHCDVCGGLLYHSIRGSHFKFTQRWFWNGSFRSIDECDVCGDCLRAIGYVVEKNRELVARRVSLMSDKYPAEQMGAYQPTTWRKVLNIFKKEQNNV